MSSLLGAFVAALALSALSASAQNDARAAAFALEKQGKNAEAEEAWRGMARKYPKDAEPEAHLGLLAARQEHYSEAVACYRKALALNPEMAGLRTNLGLALFKNGQYKDTVQIFEPMLKSQPSSPEAARLTLLLGMSYYGLGEYASASPYLLTASQQNPQNLTLLLTLAHSCLLARRFPCVLDEYHQIVAQNADSAEAHMLVRSEERRVGKECSS